MNYENEIDKIINSEDFTSEKYKPLNEVITERENIIDKAFEKYMKYDANIKNKPVIIEELSEYQYVPCEQLDIGDTVKELIVKPFFFKIRLSTSTVVTDKNQKKIKLRNSCFRKICDETYFFKLLKNSDIVKMKLMELIQES